MIAYHRPRSLEEALVIRGTRDVLLVAGGTDVYPAHAARRAWGEPRERDVLDLTAIPGLDRIEETEAGWRLGCLVTWSALRRANLPPLFDGLKVAAREIGGVQVQNRGTLIGNLVTASPAGDGIPNLLALDAAVEIAGARPRMQALRDFLKGYRSTALAPDEIAVALHVPRLAGGRGAFGKLGARRYLVISIAMAAAVIAADEAGRITGARLAVGACSAVAQRLATLEAALPGVTLRDAAEVAQPAHLDGLLPVDDIRGTAAYRRDAALTLVRDLLRGLA